MKNTEATTNRKPLTITEMREQRLARMNERCAYWEARIEAEHQSYLKVMGR